MATTQAPLELNPFIGGAPVSTSDTYEVRSPYDDDARRRRPPRRAGARSRRRSRGPCAAFQTTRKLPSWQRAEILDADRATRSTRRGTTSRGRSRSRRASRSRPRASRPSAPRSRSASPPRSRSGSTARSCRSTGCRATRAAIAQVRRVPLGAVAGITPFNFPLNLVAHKVAPALAAGNPIVLRPASQTPISALKLGADRPRGRLAARTGSRSCRRRRPTRRRSSRTTGSSC